MLLVENSATSLHSFRLPPFLHINIKICVNYTCCYRLYNTVIEWLLHVFYVDSYTFFFLFVKRDISQIFSRQFWYSDISACDFKQRPAVFTSPKRPALLCNPPNLLLLGYLSPVSPGVKINTLSPSTAEDAIAWNCVWIPAYAVIS